MLVLRFKTLYPVNLTISLTRSTTTGGTGSNCSSGTCVKTILRSFLFFNVPAINIDKIRIILRSYPTATAFQAMELNLLNGNV